MRTLAYLLFLLPATTFAWGPTGHRVAGAIAENHLSPKARKAVNRILGSQSLAMASTWMDDVRSDHAYDHARDWHWVTIPDGSTYATAEKNPDGDVVEAINRMITALKSDTLPTERQAICLKMLIHLVGDLHQPLHVGRGDDKGGNQYQVEWFRKGSNLHRVWDNQMIDEKDLSYTELATSLDVASDSLVKELMHGTVADWAQENLAFRSAVYAPEKGADLGYQYMYGNWPTVERQLLKAGIRTAGLLNAIFK